MQCGSPAHSAAVVQLGSQTARLLDIVKWLICYTVKEYSTISGNDLYWCMNELYSDDGTIESIACWMLSWISWNCELDQFVAVAKSSNACLLHDSQRRSIDAIHYTTVNAGQHSLEDKQIIKRLKQRGGSVVAWLCGNALVSINEVTLRHARLVLGWVTVCERVNHLGM